MTTNTCDPDFDQWWRDQTAKGDPSRNPRLVEQAFAAGKLAQAARLLNETGQGEHGYHPSPKNQQKPEQ